ncbi:phospholipid scramblase-related protein [Psychromonas algicola]|uniref:phospholipid scramblase-related protein n=1 Tax=Psychromonas algicola TaxID=2555642 RepID=UPI0010682080|nr:phospholipid scramblase-related protein [Psychromonas sp. RZ5]TEW47836.1 RNAase [Psychromonas sp. RZ5]
MSNVINKNAFFIKEHVGLFKAANNFDIYDPETNQLIMECREPNLGFFTKLLRFTDYKRMTPFDVQIRTPDGQRIVRIKRGISLFISEVVVTDQDDQVIGGFAQKFFSIGGKFDVQDKNNQTICQLEGKWTSWDFYFRNNGKEFAHVSKEWAGLGKEMFTSADNYVLQIAENVPENDDIRKLIIAAVMCIDMVLKE